VYFDFGSSESGDTVRFDKPVLWRLNPRSSNARAYLSPVVKSSFLEIHLTGQTFETAQIFEEMYTRLVEQAATSYAMQQAAQFRRPMRFERHMAKRQRTRARF
jgi:hypothetical protein